MRVTITATVCNSNTHKGYFSNIGYNDVVYPTRVMALYTTWIYCAINEHQNPKCLRFVSLSYSSFKSVLLAAMHPCWPLHVRVTKWNMRLHVTNRSRYRYKNRQYMNDLNLWYHSLYNLYGIKWFICVRKVMSIVRNQKNTTEVAAAIKDIATSLQWASCQILKIAGCACAGVAFPAIEGQRSRHASRTVSWCKLGSLISSSFHWSWWRGKRSRHFRHMRSSQYYVSGNRSILMLNSNLGKSRLPMAFLLTHTFYT